MVEITRTVSFVARTCAVILSFCTVLVVVSLLAGQAQYPSVISFASSSGGGDYHLHLMDIALNRTRKLSDHNIFCCPVWSQDGDKIIFIESYNQGPSLKKRLYVMNADGSDARPLTATSAPDILAADWSPDGNHIVYVTMRLQQDTEIAVLDTQTGITHQITHNNQDDDSPQWSPDGRFIIFKSRSNTGNWDIFRMNASGEEVQQLTNSPDNDLYPRISPNSRRIAFVSDRSGNQDLFVMNADGSALQQLTWTPTLEKNPFWSPDGTRILFQSQRRGATSSSIYRIDADGRNMHQIMSSTASSFLPATLWSPDGTHILFLSKTEAGDTDMFVMDADGNHVRRLTSSVERDTYPAWQPG